MEKKNHKLLIKNATEIVTVCDKGETLKKGVSQGHITKLDEGWIIVGSDGLISHIGKESDLRDIVNNSQFERVIDAAGKCVLPGFVDSHTHPVWSGDRVHEFVMKLGGASYMDIHNKGGGIGFTVRHTKESSEEKLAELFKERLDRMLRMGTTVVEAKSGYGLEIETEVKMLKVIQQVDRTHPIDVVANYCGAHSVPSATTAAEQTKDIVEKQIPKIAELMKEGLISPSLIDVFCEKNVFDIEQTRQILEAGKRIGLEANFHGDELSPIKAGELAGDIGALAMSHCEETSDTGIQAMAKRPTIALLLPTTAYLLKLKYPPARKFIDNQVPVALGTDFNPNAHCLSMPLVMNLACVNMGLTMEEALVAATINSAAALGKSSVCGSLEVGKNGDMLILDATRWEHLIYQMVDPPITTVIKKGKIVWEK